jgi:hypothetical protein
LDQEDWEEHMQLGAGGGAEETPKAKLSFQKRHPVAKFELLPKEHLQGLRAASVAFYVFVCLFVHLTTLCQQCRLQSVE